MLGNSLKNKKIIISAGASGIGWAITKVCVVKGASVYLCDVDPKAINKVKKHQKPDNNQAGGIIEKEMPINFSNLAYYDSISKKGVKLGYKFNEKKEKIRIIRNSGKEI